MKNALIREALKEYNLKQWELADLLGISEYTLCKRLRKELPEEEKKRIVAIIKTNGKQNKPCGID